MAVATSLAMRPAVSSTVRLLVAAAALLPSAGAVLSLHREAPAAIGAGWGDLPAAVLQSRREIAVWVIHGTQSLKAYPLPYTQEEGRGVAKRKKGERYRSGRQ